MTADQLPYADRYHRAKGQMNDWLPGGPKYTGALHRGETPKKTTWQMCPGCDLGAVEMTEDGEAIGPCWCAWRAEREP